MKQLSVKINGIDYFPGNILSATEEPLTECSVNYRALVNDKLQELGTFWEPDDGGAVKDDSLLLVASSFSDSDSFIIAGRIQEVLINIAYYTGNTDYPLVLSLPSIYTWKDAYTLLLDSEHFIKTGERGVEKN